jgi:hypothetical protein
MFSLCASSHRVRASFLFRLRLLRSWRCSCGLFNPSAAPRCECGKANPSLKGTESRKEVTEDKEDEDFEEKPKAKSKGRRRKRAEDDDGHKARKKKTKPTPKPKDPKLKPKCGLLQESLCFFV